jgi:hypothetical protein
MIHSSRQGDRRRVHTTSTRVPPFLTVIASLAAATAGGAQQRPPSKAEADQRWTAIRRVFGQEGEAEGGYFRVNLPRTDLRVRIGDDTLAAGFELTSYVGFMPAGRRDVVAMGEVIVRDDEVPAALAELHAQGVRVSAVHNHLIGEIPRIMYVHVLAEGAPETVANKLRAVFAKTATPLTKSQEEPSTVDWSAIDAVLGKHAEAEGRVAEYVFPRKERLTVHGMGVESTGMLETASEVVLQQLGGGRMACGGELFVLPGEVDPVVRALDEHGLHVTAVHNHMVDETPRMYWIHWYGTGDGPTLARGVAAALAHMNSARKSASER